MKVFMIGGTGLLGSEAAKELIARGHEVSSISTRMPESNLVFHSDQGAQYTSFAFRNHLYPRPREQL